MHYLLVSPCFLSYGIHTFASNPSGINSMVSLWLYRFIFILIILFHMFSLLLLSLPSSSCSFNLARLRVACTFKTLHRRK